MELLRIASESLRRHKLRSFLTLLGVIIGVTTVVSVVSIISGLNNYITEKVFQMNPDVFIVTKFGIIMGRDEFMAALRRKNIDMSDVRAVQRQCSRCKMIGVNDGTRGMVRYGGQKVNGVQIQGQTANMGELMNLDLEAGRYFTEAEVSHGEYVAVIGADVKEQIFPRLDPIGRTIRIGGEPYRVIGLITKQGSVFGESQDLQVQIPLPAYLQRFGTRRSLSMFIRAEGGVAGVSAAQDEVRTIMRTRRRTAFRGADPFGLVNAEALQIAWKRISGGMFALMTFISGISLIVGGIVIMNIMLVSVVERTREIGIRRALGARKRDIMLQFLTEATLLSLFGGIVGVLLGVGIAKGISAAFPLPTLVRPGLILAGLLLAVVTGLLAGVVPAKRAANLPPVEALRFE